MSTTPHILANGDFIQTWSNPADISVNDDWSAIPGLVGYLGDIDAGSTTNVDPRTLTGAPLGAADVIANQADPSTLTSGGVAEFDGLTDPTIALQGSGTADAPSLVIYLDATGRENVHLTFDARDVDGSADNAAQQIAVQYRLGQGSTWINLAGGYAADVTTGGAATQSTAFDIILPAAANGASDLQVRILTTNASGSDEWVGIDNIEVTSLAAGESVAPGTDVNGITILDMAASLTGSVETPVASGALEMTRIGSWLSGDGEGGSESIAFDTGSGRAFVTNAASDRVEILDLSDPANPTKVGAIELSGFEGYGEVNSVAVHDGLVAVAVQNADGGEAGLVALYDTDGTLLNTLTVGVLPDQLTFSPDGALLLVANEGEPYYDETADVIENASGTVSIIDVSGGAAAAVVRNTIGFDALDGFEDTLSELGIKIYTGSEDLPAPTASQDIEPEYITVSPDGTTAYVTLQEVDAVAAIDLTDAGADKPVSILPLGYVDFSLAGNEGDFSDRDGEDGSASISVGNAPVKGLLQPDAIASFELDGVTYFVTANEGDSRVVANGADGFDEARASKLGATDADYARYNLNTTWATEDDYVGFGGRGFSIFQQNVDGTIVKVDETGGDFEQIFAELPNAQTVFNGENGGDFDSRSDNKAAEPEGITVGEVDGKTYAFVGLERLGGVIVWDVSTPDDAQYVTYVPPTEDDYGPEVITFVSAEDSPSGHALLLTANEISGSVTVYDLAAIGAGITKISTIQGEGEASPLVGETVTVDAIVVGDFQNGDADEGRNLNGFYLQEEATDSDGNPLTSEGLFVYGGSTDVKIGDRVQVTGTVSEYYGQTQLTASEITIVEAGAVEDVNTMAVAIELPAEAATLNQNGAYQPDLEAYEGMLVTFPETLTISEQYNLDRFNEIKLVAGERAAQFTQDHAPSIEDYAAYLEDLGARTITYDDGLNTQNQPITNLDGFGPTYDTASAPRMGDTVTGLTGVLDYQWAGSSSSGATWRVRSVEDGTNTFESANPRPTEVEDVGGDIQVATFNVLNYFTTLSGEATATGLDPRGATTADELDRQTEKLVTAILGLDAEVLALNEVENDFLAGSSGNALEHLVDALNAEVGAEIYDWVDPGTQFVGSDAIAVGFIYNSQAVHVASNTTIEILDDSDLADLGLGSLLTDSTVGGIFNGENTSRAALAVTFEEVDSGAEFTAVANHLKSKSGTGTGADADQLDGQGAWQQQREFAATALTQWVATDPTGSGDSDVLLLGDFNSYFSEETISLITLAGYENLQARLEGPYSYVFDGQTGTLDYIFANQSISTQITGVTEWHINADEADALDYNTDYGRDAAIFDGADPARVSDHDPLVIGLDLEEETEVAYTLQLLHFSDQEAGLLAVDTAPNLAALVDAFDDDYENTLILSSGDNFIAGPFLAAGTDPSVISALNEVSGSTLSTTATVPLAAADMAILNTIGVEASAIGNHEFDLGSRVLRDAINASSTGWVGAAFPYISANLSFGPTSPYYAEGFPTDGDLNSLYVDTIDYNSDPTQNADPTTTEIAEASTLAGKIAPSAVITEGGEKIGIVGVTTQMLEAISSPTNVEVGGFPAGTGANGETNDMDLLAAQIQPIIDELTAEGVNKIVLVSHLQQLSYEEELATKLSGVDIIIAGGSHTRLADADDELASFPGHEATAADTYPIVTQDADGNTTLIVNTDNEYTYLGRLVVDFDDAGNIILDSVADNVALNGAWAATEDNVAEAWGVDVADLDATAFADGTKGGDVAILTDAVQDVINAKDGNVLGLTEVYLEGERTYVRTEETNLGDLSADANLWYGRQVDESVLVSVKNGGGIRSAIGTVSNPDPITGEIDKLPPFGNADAGKPDGGISQLDIENSLRFNNSLSLITVTAEQMVEVLEHAVAATTATSTPGQFGQFGGVAFSYDIDLPAGERVLSAALIGEDGEVILPLVEDGELVVNADLAIRVVTLSYLVTGGDSYPFAAFVAENPEFANVVDLTAELMPDAGQASDFATEGTEQDALAEYLQEFFTETPYAVADTGRDGDTRIQNLDYRDDTVLDGVIIAGLGHDSMDGTDGDDIMFGLDGKDMLDGLGGDDTLYGNAGRDRLYGNDGNDHLFGGEASDILTGSAGNDLLDGGAGADRLYGGSGNDTYVVDDAGDQVVEGTSNGIDTVLTTLASFTLGANVENLTFTGTGAFTGLGNALDNTLTGGAGRDRLYGLDGDDQLIGEAGNDILTGSAGNDTLNGGAGSDRLYGGIGADTFVFRPGFGNDTVHDFSINQGDVIELDAAVFADFAALDGALADTAAGATITYEDGSTLLLSQVAASSLGADDFRFV